MRTVNSPVRKWFLIVTCCLVVFSLIAYGRHLLQTSKPQHLTLSLGATIAQIEQRSTYRFDPRHVSLAVDIYAVSTPVVITVATPACSVTFPEGRYAALDVNDGKLVDFDLSPHLQYLTFDEALRLNKLLIQQIEAAGWKKDPAAHRPSVAEVPMRLDQVSDGRKIDVDGWLCSGQAMQLQLQRQYKAGTAAASRSALKGDSYVVTVSVGPVV